MTLVFCAPVWSEVAVPVELWLDAPCDVGVCGTEVSLDPADVVSVGVVVSAGAVVGADWSLEELEAFEPLGWLSADEVTPPPPAVPED